MIIGVEGNGFLWNMVRIMVGTLVQVGIGQYKPDDSQDDARREESPERPGRPRRRMDCICSGFKPRMTRSIGMRNWSRGRRAWRATRLDCNFRVGVE